MYYHIMYGTCTVHVPYMYYHIQYMYSTCIITYSTCTVHVLYMYCTYDSTGRVHILYMYRTYTVYVQYMYNVLSCWRLHVSH